MDAMHWVLAVAALACAGGVVWLLAQRGALATRVGVAEGAAAAERERREAGEEAGRARAGEFEAVRAALALAEGQVKKFEAQLAAAADAHVAAVTAERELHRQAVEGSAREHAAKLQTLAAAKQEIEAKLAAFDQKMKEAFGLLAGEALTRTMKLAEERMTAERAGAAAALEGKRAEIDGLVKPIGETLKLADAKLAAIQQQWAADRASLATELKAMGDASVQLRGETGKLAKALSRPEVRGRWGELQLRRAAELAGMTAYCDFCEQLSGRDAEGRVTRPDLIVKLPNDRVIAVDAKTNTDAYLAALNAGTDAERDGHLDRFARHVGEQAASLGKKQYWKDFESSPDFVIMFIPGDGFLDAALSRNPGLLDDAMGVNVLIATPATLIGLLRAVAMGWREKAVNEQAQQLFELGKLLHERAATAYAKLDGLGKALDGACKKYNEFVGSYESRLEPTLRRFEEVGAKSGKELPEMEAIGVVIREIAAKPSVGRPAGFLEA